jgi:hypothetical protein
VSFAFLDQDSDFESEFKDRKSPISIRIGSSPAQKKTPHSKFRKKTGTKSVGWRKVGSRDREKDLCEPGSSRLAAEEGAEGSPAHLLPSQHRFSLSRVQNKGTCYSKGGFFALVVLYILLFNTASSADSPVWRMLGSIPGLLQFWH